MKTLKMIISLIFALGVLTAGISIVVNMKSKPEVQSNLKLDFTSFKSSNPVLVTYKPVDSESAQSLWMDQENSELALAPGFYTAKLEQFAGSTIETSRVYGLEIKHGQTTVISDF